MMFQFLRHRINLLVLPATLALAGLILAVRSCVDEDIAVKQEFTLNVDLGGDTTRFEVSRNAFSLPAPELTNQQRRTFEVGDSFFTQNWVTAPSSTKARDGLGPTFNAQACSSCHVLDGRGAPPDPSGEETRLGLLLRLSIPGSDPETGAPLPDPNYGGQLQDRSVVGVPAEGTLLLTYDTIEGTYGDGTSYELRVPDFDVLDLAFGPLSEDIGLAPRLAPQVIGMGLLQAIPAESILALADPDDSNGDGISGEANMVWDSKSMSKKLGRFGWKASVPTIEQQSAGAFHGDIGITSVLHPEENCPLPQSECADAANGGAPELTESRLQAVEFYVRTLAVPAMRDADNSDILAGAKLFENFGCASCHTTTHHTAEADIEALSNQVFHPYTDLLLHDMGPGLADESKVFEADENEWRTPPLWGIGLIEEINGQRFLLHDGRARTLEEAILWHGGEGEAAREAFRLADAAQRAQLIAFLEAL